jgi:hypothetical protein
MADTPLRTANMLGAISTLVNDVMYRETSVLPDDVVMVGSVLTVTTVPKGEEIDEDGDRHRTLTVDASYQFGEEPVDTGMTPDRALLCAHRLIAEAYAFLKQFGVEAEHGA